MMAGREEEAKSAPLVTAEESVCLCSYAPKALDGHPVSCLGSHESYDFNICGLILWSMSQMRFRPNANSSR